MDANEALFVKDVIDAELTADDGFESHMFTVSFHGLGTLNRGW